VLRGKNCNRYTFPVDIPVTVMVNAAGQALLRDNLVKGKKVYSLTADYLFGHDLAKAAKNFYTANGATQIGDELVATDVTDFSPYLLKIRQAKPDLVSTNLAGNQVTNFVKQYAEFGLPYPVAGFNLNTADAWAAGEGNLSGIWPTVWHHELQTPGSKAFVAEFMKRYGKPPENHAWIEYVSLKILAQAMNDTKSTDTDKLIAYFESEAQFDILKARKGYFRSWDHQLMQEAYPFTVKAKGQAKDKWDFLKFGEAVPAPNQPLELLAPSKADNTCVM
jgi:branched-chain amino acid transport system substrate-binding protein